METTGEVVNTTGGSNEGHTVVRSNASSEFHMAPRSETSNPPPTSVAPSPPPPQNSLAPTAPPPTTEGFPSGPTKKKRGRPRKYGHDRAAVTLSPDPISSAAPATSQSRVIDFSAAEKRCKVKPGTASSFVRTKYQVENLGQWAPSPAEANFTPRIITVNAGEDVTKRIISFSQQGSLAICVLCANGVISSVTLRQPDSFGGTLTYEGRFEILSLSGSFTPSDSDGTRSRTGGMTVSLADPEGRVIGGGVAGLLVAATPIQVVVGSFISGTNHQAQNPRKQHNHNFTSSPIPTIHHTPSSLHMGTWTPPPLASNPQHKPPS